MGHRPVIRTATWKEVLEYGAKLPRSLKRPIGGSAGYSAVVLADSPVSYWPLNEPAGSTTVADNSSGGNTGTVQGGVTLGNPGALIGDPSTSALLNGTTGYIDIGTPANLSITGNISVEAWFQVSGTLSASDAIVSKWTANTGYMLRLNATPNVIGELGNGTSAVLPSAIGAFGTGWHHAVFTYDGTNIRVYVDGVLLGGPTAFTGPIANSTTSVKIGASLAVAGTFFPGYLAHCAIYNFTLSAQQISNHRNAGIYWQIPAPRRMPQGV